MFQGKGFVFEKIVAMNVIKFEPGANILWNESIGKIHGVYRLAYWYLRSLLCKYQPVLTLLIFHYYKITPSSNSGVG